MHSDDACGILAIEGSLPRVRGDRVAQKATVQEEADMLFQTGALRVDLMMFAIANGVNVLLTAIMLSRSAGLRRVERVLGLVLVFLALPVTLGVVLNALGGREWWTIALPSLLVVHLVLELLLDYILKIDFRHTRLLGPYLLIFYLAQMGMIGYSFATGRVWGFVTLGTYFLSLLATWVSYATVGHGVRMSPNPERAESHSAE